MFDLYRPVCYDLKYENVLQGGRNERQSKKTDTGGF